MSGSAVENVRSGLDNTKGEIKVTLEQNNRLRDSLSENRAKLLKVQELLGLLDAALFRANGHFINSVNFARSSQNLAEQANSAFHNLSPGAGNENVAAQQSSHDAVLRAFGQFVFDTVPANRLAEVGEAGGIGLEMNHRNAATLLGFAATQVEATESRLSKASDLADEFGSTL